MTLRGLRSRPNLNGKPVKVLRQAETPGRVIVQSIPCTAFGELSVFAHAIAMGDRPPSPSQWDSFDAQVDDVNMKGGQFESEVYDEEVGGAGAVDSDTANAIRAMEQRCAREANAREANIKNLHEQLRAAELEHAEMKNGGSLLTNDDECVKDHVGVGGGDGGGSRDEFNRRDNIDSYDAEDTEREDGRQDEGPEMGSGMGSSYAEMKHGHVDVGGGDGDGSRDEFSRRDNIDRDAEDAERADGRQDEGPEMGSGMGSSYGDGNRPSDDRIDSSAEKFGFDHLQKQTTNPPPGSKNIGAPYGRRARVCAVGPSDTFWGHGQVAAVLSDLEGFGRRVGMSPSQLERNISSDPPVAEVPGTKFIVRWSDSSISPGDLFVSNKGSWHSRGFKSDRYDTMYKVCTEVSTMPHAYWVKRDSALKNPRPCPCAECRGFGSDQFKMRVSIRKDYLQLLKGGKSSISKDALVLIEYIGNAAARKHLAHALSHDNQKGTSRTFPSTRDDAFRARQSSHKMPINISIASREESDPRRSFSSDRATREATRGAAGGTSNSRDTQGDVAKILSLLTQEADAERAKIAGFKKVVQVVKVDEDIVIGCWTSEGLAVPTLNHNTLTHTHTHTTNTPTHTTLIFSIHAIRRVKHSWEVVVDLWRVPHP